MPVDKAFGRSRSSPEQGVPAPTFFCSLQSLFLSFHCDYSQFALPPFSVGLRMIRSATSGIYVPFFLFLLLYPQEVFSCFEVSLSTTEPKKP